MEGTSFGAEPSFKLLIVEDEKNLGELLADYMAKQCLTIDIVQDGDEALDKLKKSPYDIVLTEIAVQGATSLELLQESKRSNPNAIVIIMTTHASIEMATGAVKKGAYDFITKPFKLDELDVTISRAIENVKLLREKEQLLNNLKIAKEELKNLKVKKAGENGPYGKGITHSEEVGADVGAPLFDPLPMHYSGRSGKRADELMEKLDRLNQLREKGALTVNEYFVLKSKIFSPEDKED